MNTAITLMGAGMLALSAAGWLLAVAPRMAGRLRVLISLLLLVFAASTASQGFGVGGVGSELPGWQQIGQLAKLLLYGAAGFSLLSLYLAPVRINWGGWNGLALYGLSLALAGAFATVPGFAEASIYPTVVALIGAVVVQYVRHDRLLRAIRWALFALCWGSILYWIVLPEWATSNPDALYNNLGAAYETGLLAQFGITQRWHGLIGHGNGLGYVAATALLLGLYAPARLHRLFWERAGLAAALVCLVMSQSKTMWIATALGYAVWALVRVASQPPVKRALAQVVLSAGVVAGLAAVTIYAPTLDGADLTLTGRTDIWAITLAETQANPIGGYGPSLWDEDYRNSKGEGYQWVGQAHNQVVQTLGQSGVIGAAGLLAALLTLLDMAWRNRHLTNGASLALLTLLIVRGISETSLRFGLDIGALVVLTIYLVVTATPYNHTLRSPSEPA
ncbi:O-antigen ligase family protein [Deinococcus sp. Arct2-2]|uniref:O-antigen ligase family protein n=1 Tax=Deinococcus sp. Arct2-2 TaxID=2568653 RepID=UPI0010A3447A|nr:O-antigen ligase family protein [Deinococcus sp. Arct2-2]THF68044.1 O-antigen ligase family protein [Deinococcus sp. Arct2-2]